MLPCSAAPQRLDHSSGYSNHAAVPSLHLPHACAATVLPCRCCPSEAGPPKWLQQPRSCPQPASATHLCCNCAAVQVLPLKLDHLNGYDIHMLAAALHALRLQHLPMLHALTVAVNHLASAAAAAAAAVAPVSATRTRPPGNFSLMGAPQPVWLEGPLPQKHIRLRPANLCAIAQVCLDWRSKHVRPLARSVCDAAAAAMAEARPLQNAGPLPVPSPPLLSPVHLQQLLPLQQEERLGWDYCSGPESCMKSKVQQPFLRQQQQQHHQQQQQQQHQQHQQQHQQHHQHQQHQAQQGTQMPALHDFTGGFSPQQLITLLSSSAYYKCVCRLVCLRPQQGLRNKALMHT